MTTSIEIILNRPNKIYYENVGVLLETVQKRKRCACFLCLTILQESVSGLLQIHCSTETKHDGIFASIEGAINLMMGKKSVGILDSFSGTTKPIQLLANTVQLAAAGKLPQGFSELALEFPLVACVKEQKTLFETYHGIFININYTIKCELRRNFLSKSMQRSQQFVIQYRPKVQLTENVLPFTISPENLRKVARERIAIPRFLITGRLDTTECCITKPLTGHVSGNDTRIFNNNFTDALNV